MLRDRNLLDGRGNLRDGVDVPLPDSVQALIAARLDSLPPEHKTLLQLASVVGRCSRPRRSPACWTSRRTPSRRRCTRSPGRTSCAPTGAPASRQRRPASGTCSSVTSPTRACRARHEPPAREPGLVDREPCVRPGRGRHRDPGPPRDRGAHPGRGDRRPPARDGMRSAAARYPARRRTGRGPRCAGRGAESRCRDGPHARGYAQSGCASGPCTGARCSTSAVSGKPAKP